MLDNEGYKHTLTICNTYYSSTSTMVAPTPLSVRLYVQYIPSLVCGCSRTLPAVAVPVFRISYGSRPLPSSAPHFKIFQVIVIYFPKCPRFISKCNTLLTFSLIQVQFPGEQVLLLLLLLLESCFCHGNPRFNFRVYLASFVVRLPKLL